MCQKNKQIGFTFFQYYVAEVCNLSLLPVPTFGNFQVGKKVLLNHGLYHVTMFLTSQIVFLQGLNI